jgi:hypothetical protein
MTTTFPSTKGYTRYGSGSSCGACGYTGFGIKETSCGWCSEQGLSLEQADLKKRGEGWKISKLKSEVEESYVVEKIVNGKFYEWGRYRLYRDALDITNIFTKKG